MVQFKQVKLPLLSVEIINFNLEDTFSVLQGVSRYIDSIFIKEELVVNEGFDVLNLLHSRYPSKKIILNITKRKKLDAFVESVVKKTKIKFFVVAGKSDSIEFQKLCNFLNLHKKKLILIGQEINLPFLQKINCKHFLYFKPQNKKDKQYWTASDLIKIKLLTKKNIFVTVGNIVDSNIEQFKNTWVDEFLVSEEVCYSFNPINTCRSIYSEIKKYYL